MTSRCPLKRRSAICQRATRPPWLWTDDRDRRISGVPSLDLRLQEAGYGLERRRRAGDRRAVAEAVHVVASRKLRVVSNEPGKCPPGLLSRAAEPMDQKNEVLHDSQAYYELAGFPSHDGQYSR